METLEPRLLLSGDGIDIEKFVYAEPVSVPNTGEVICGGYAGENTIDQTGQDADSPAEAIIADVGATVIWTYVVTNVDQEPMSDITVVDDNGTPDFAADDFSPAAIMEGDFNVGDLNTDGLLDIGEEWLFTASDLVKYEGLYGNTATASVTVEGPGGGDPAGFVNYAVLTQDMISIGNNFSVADGILGSNGNVFADMSFEAPMGVRGAGVFGELGGSTIGTAGSDAIVFNGGAFLYTNSVINGDIRIGAGDATVFGAGVEINGEIFTGGDTDTVEMLDEFFMPITYTGVINTFDDPAPFTELDFTPLDDFNPVYDFVHGSVSIGVNPGDTNTELTLESGNHYFDSLNFGHNTTLKLTLTDGSITIFVADVENTGMSIGHDFVMELTDGEADDVYIEIDTNLFVGDRATMAGTFYSPGGDMFFGTDLRLTGAIYGGATMAFGGDAVAGGPSDIQFEQLDFAAIGMEVGGGGGGELIVLSDSDSAYYDGVLPATDITNFGQKAEALVMQYTGDNIIDHSQDPTKVIVTGDPQDAPTVRIVASSKPNVDDSKAKIYFDSQVNLDEMFAAEAMIAGKTKLKNEIFLTIFDLEGQVLGTAQFHTSMSQPLVLGDQFGAIRLVGFVGDDGARAGVVPVEMQTGLSGFVFNDANGDGLVDQDEYAVSGATVTLTGINDRGQEINRVETTDSDGAYYFDALRPGNYTITETQPAGYYDGIDSIGTAGGTLLANDTVAEIALGAYIEGENYNFAEIRTNAGPDQIVLGQTATIGFWAGKKGKKLIESLNGDKYSTLLADWLARELPEIYGDLAGKSNKGVAKYYHKLFKAGKKHRKHRHRHHADEAEGIRDLGAQVMATALAVYVTDSDLAGTAAESYGFLVTEEGVGLATFNVEHAAAAFGLLDDQSTIMTVFDILRATNEQTVGGDLYDMDTILSALANEVYTMINEIGGIN